MFRATRDTLFLSARAGGGCEGSGFPGIPRPLPTHRGTCLPRPKRSNTSQRYACRDVFSINSSINQWLSSTDEWVFGCHGQAMQKYTNSWFPREVYFNEITAFFYIKRERLTEHCLVSLCHACCNFNRSVCPAAKGGNQLDVSQKVWKRQKNSYLYQNLKFHI